ncbi:MAG: ABC transporter ATP-binding protein, partial [bacterium]|nr:ABC transporter ATP-binding protein [bacterium]
MSIYKRSFSYLKPHFWWIMTAMICSVGVAAGEAAPAYILKKIFEQVLNDKNTQMLAVIAIGVVAIIVLKGLFYFFQTYSMAFVGQRVIFSIRNELYMHLQRLSLSFYDNRETGQIMSRVLNDVMILQNLLTFMAQVIKDSMLIVFLLGWIFYIHWRLSLLIFIIVPVIGFVIATFSRRMRKLAYLIQAKVGDITSITQETIAGIRIVKSFTAEEYEIDRFVKKNEETFNVNMKNSKVFALILPVVEVLNTTGLAVVLWYGGKEVIKGNLTGPELISYLTALGMLYTPVKRLTHVNAFVQQAMACSSRVFEILDTEEQIKDKPDAIELESIQGDVRFEAVSFSYNEDEKVLTDVNLKVESGLVLAVVGSSGAGKTTFVNLIPRFYEVTKGRVLVDGLDIRDVKIKSLRRQIGIVPQETLLFSGTVAENISYGRQEATPEEIVEAAKAANADDFVRSFPHGYETEVGEKGVKLSGG